VTRYRVDPATFRQIPVRFAFSGRKSRQGYGASTLDPLQDRENVDTISRSQPHKSELRRWSIARLNGGLWTTFFCQIVLERDLICEYLLPESYRPTTRTLVTGLSLRTTTVPKIWKILSFISTPPDTEIIFLRSAFTVEVRVACHCWNVV
jgi:hypothetical protein